MIAYNKQGVNVSAANTQQIFTISVEDLEELSIVFAASGGAGVFASQNATIEISNDNATWISVDTVGLGTGNKLGKFYNENNKATTVPVNIMAYPYIRVTVPAIGVSIVTTCTWSGKTKYYH